MLEAAPKLYFAKFGFLRAANRPGNYCNDCNCYKYRNSFFRKGLVSIVAIFATVERDLFEKDHLVIPKVLHSQWPHSKQALCVFPQAQGIDNRPYPTEPFCHRRFELAPMPKTVSVGVGVVFHSPSGSSSMMWSDRCEDAKRLTTSAGATGRTGGGCSSTTTAPPTWRPCLRSVRRWSIHGNLDVTRCWSLSEVFDNTLTKPCQNFDNTSATLGW
jgi:hypothetical protein